MQADPRPKKTGRSRSSLPVRMLFGSRASYGSSANPGGLGG